MNTSIVWFKYIINTFFQGNVIIVDTPGCGDKEQTNVAEKTMSYLPNALAFVFVLNVANAGGIQDDRVFDRDFCLVCNLYYIAIVYFDLSDLFQILRTLYALYILILVNRLPRSFIFFIWEIKIHVAFVETFLHEWQHFF